MSRVADVSDEGTRRFEEFARTRDPALRDAIIEDHLGLAHQLARRFTNRGEPYDDLTQVASMALIKAVDRFDPERGVKFSTFAVSYMVGELKRHFRDKGWAVRAPRRIQELYLEVGRRVETLTHEIGRVPTVAELAEDLGTSPAAVLEAMEAGRGYRATSLDRPQGDEGAPQDLPVLDDDTIGLVEDRSVLAIALKRLTPRERELIRLRFIEGLTQTEIAKRIGVSQMQVSRLLAQSLGRLRSRLESDDAD